MKNKIGLIIQREYLSRVRKRSFLLLTILVPAIFFLLIFSSVWLANVKDDTIREIEVIDQTGKYGSLFQNIDNKTYHFHTVNPNDTGLISQGHNRYATLFIFSDLLENPSAITLSSERQVTGDLTAFISQTLNNYLQDEKLASYNIPHLKEILEESKVHINLQTLKQSDTSQEGVVSSSEWASTVGIIFAAFIYIFILTYGGMVMQGVMEEKTNRIIEVMVSSVKPFTLMLGKIIGIGLVGLTQFLIWLLLAVALILSGSAYLGIDSPVMQSVTGVLSSINLGEIIIYFLIFFIGGYMMYASLFAAIGSLVNSQEDAQQFMLPVTMVILFAFYAAISGTNNPDGPMAFWASLIPLSSPIVMMVRIPFDIPLWQKLLSVGLLYVTFFFCIRFATKIYRTGILMYGKKPDLKEIIKWLKYKA